MGWGKGLLRGDGGGGGKRRGSHWLYVEDKGMTMWIPVVLVGLEWMSEDKKH